MLEVPGASLHYEVSGDGPVLLLIPGGPADGKAFAAVAPVLAKNYTVLTYDPRGLSRSVVDDRTRVIPVEQQAADAARLLDAVGGGPAAVFANSGGAVTGLALLTADPSLVTTLVAHEPPLIGLLPDAAERNGAVQRVNQTYREQGIGPAMALFLAFAGFPGPEAQTAPGSDQPPPSGPEPVAVPGSWEANLELFFGQMMLPITTYRPDLPALRAVSDRIVVGGGAASVGQTAQLTAAALAAALGTELTVFPGAHGGFSDDPDGFAHRLDQVLTDRAG